MYGSHAIFVFQNTFHSGYLYNDQIVPSYMGTTIFLIFEELTSFIYH